MTPYGTAHTHLTPLDLYAAGYTVHAHTFGWCWHRRNPHGPGQLWGAPYATVEDVIADARHRAVIADYPTLTQTGD